MAFVGNSPVVAFNAGFDVSMIEVPDVHGVKVRGVPREDRKAHSARYDANLHYQVCKSLEKLGGPVSQEWAEHGNHNYGEWITRFGVVGGAYGFHNYIGVKKA